MKRSEAITIIESFDYHQGGTYGEEVLAALEEAGLLPPMVKKHTSHKPEYETIATLSWEPEDQPTYKEIELNKKLKKLAGTKLGK